MSEGTGLARRVNLLHTLRSHGVLGTLRVLAVFAFVVALVSFSRPTWLSLAIGLPVVAIGLWWRVWSAGHLIKTKELAVSGPYRYVQNPLYFGRLGMLTGLCVAATLPVTWGGRLVLVNLVALLVMWIVFFGYYIPRKKRVEGSRLAKYHGESYTTWAANVPVVIPRLTPYGVNERRWDRERFHELREIYVVVVASVACLALVARVLGWWPPLG